MSTKTSLRQIKLTKRAKVAIGRTKVFQGDGETLVSEKKDIRRKKISRTSSNDGVSVTYENNKLYKRESTDETTRGGRKRVFADRSNDRERRVNGGFGKFSDKERRGKSDSFERVEKGRSLGRERKSRETDSFDRLITVKKRDNDRIDRRERSNNRDGNGGELIGRPTKEKIFGKKNISDDRQERRKKMKRDIRIDPHDISNKRLDDAIATTGEAKKKEVDIDKEKRVEMSMNAQFRAIIPSPSILSFVEDNYLGRRRMIELSRAGYNTELSAPLDNIPSSKISDRERIEEPLQTLSPSALLYQANPTWDVDPKIKKAVQKKGRKVFRNKLTFFAAANVSSSFPASDLPEIAFAGRSNVGKSSMLNALTRQWGVARTSDKPGLTQTINFFKLGPKVSLVDLPGYGFAYAKEEVKEAWEDLVKEYVSTREGLKRVCLLIDTKWGMKPRDIELIDLMERSQTKYQIVLTKTDLVFPIDVARRAMQIEESLKAKKSAVQPVMMVSSKSGAGIRTLRTVLSKIARIAKV